MKKLNITIGLVIFFFIVIYFAVKYLPEDWRYSNFEFKNGNIYTHFRIVDSYNDMIVIDNFDGFLKCDPALKIKITFDQKNFFRFYCSDRFPGRKNLKTQRLVYTFQLDPPDILGDNYEMNDFVKTWFRGGPYMIGLYYSPPNANW